MDSEDRKILQHMSDTLDQVLVVMKKPENIFIKIVELISTIVGVLTVITIIDIIRKWFFGG
ncbi:MAG: hypothetical protein FWD28_09355 [Treponema sp.]|nr:hypothetical protein [Treponema sp.]